MPVLNKEMKDKHKDRLVYFHVYCDLQRSPHLKHLARNIGEIAGETFVIFISTTCICFVLALVDQGFLVSQ